MSQTRTIELMTKLARLLLIGMMHPALASETGFYLQSSAGVSGIGESVINAEHQHVSYDLGMQAALEMGFLANVLENATLRFGQEGLYIKNSLTKKAAEKAPAGGRLSTVGGMFNAYLDLWPTQRISFYIGSGVGLGIIEVSSADTDASQDDSSFLYQIKAGATFKASQKMALFTGYRYVHANNLNDELSEFQAPHYHIGEIGLRFTFM